MRIALIQAGVVATVIEGDLEFAQTLGFDSAVVADAGVGIGWTHDGSMFVAPVVAPPPAATVIPRDDFIERFTPAQWKAAKTVMTQVPELVQGFDLLMMKPEGTVTLTSLKVQALMAVLGQADPTNFPPETIALILTP